MNQTRTLTIGVILFVGLALASCGGGGVANAQDPFPPAGSIAFQGVATADASASNTLLDQSSGVQLTIPAGSMQQGAKVKLTTWTSQRPLAQDAHWDVSAQAVDLTLDTTALRPGSAILITLPWKKSATQLFTGVFAYLPDGFSIPLDEGPGSTAEIPIAKLDASTLQLLTNSKQGVVTVQIVVSEFKHRDGNSLSHQGTDRLVTLWSTARPMTTYASKKRVAVIIPGYRATSDVYATLTDFLESTTQFRTDGSAGTSTAFDEVDYFSYNAENPTEVSAQNLQNFISTKIGDPLKNEVHIFAHSYGGLVGRWAIEKYASPSVVDLTTFGTPHSGIPHRIMLFLAKSLDFFKSAGAFDMADTSNVISTLKASSNSKIKYYKVAGTDPNGYKLGLGELNHRIYQLIYHDFVADDGVVRTDTATSGPAGLQALPAVNHDTLVFNVANYWAANSGSWLLGMNRKVKFITISPSISNPYLGQTISCSATGYDKDSAQLDPLLIDKAFTSGIPVSWSSDNSTVASIDQHGLLSAIGTGTATITATTTGSVPTQTGHSVTASILVSVVGTFLSIEAQGVDYDDPIDYQICSFDSGTVVFDSGMITGEDQKVVVPTLSPGKYFIKAVYYDTDGDNSEYGGEVFGQIIATINGGNVFSTGLNRWQVGVLIPLNDFENATFTSPTFTIA